MNQSIIAGRYAKALFEFGKDRNVEQRLYDEMTTLLASFMREHRLHEVMANPLIRHESKVKLAEAAAGGKVSKELADFLRLVVSKRRENLLAQMSASFVELYRKQKKLLNIQLIAAIELKKPELEKIRLRAAQLTGDTVTLDTEVDKEIIGGFVMRWDTYRLDASIAGELKRIRRRLGV